jgi:hypothetical protein
LETMAAVVSARLPGMEDSAPDAAVLNLP